MDRAKILAVLLFALYLAGFGWSGSALAQYTDNATDPVYSPSWDNGDNGGTGLGPWQLYTQNSAGFFVGTSTANGGGDSDGDGDIDADDALLHKQELLPRMLEDLDVVSADDLARVLGRLRRCRGTFGDEANAPSSPS